jgi:hypothetical protein
MTEMCQNVKLHMIIIIIRRHLPARNVVWNLLETIARLFVATAL